MREIVQGELGGRLDTYLARATPFGFSGAVLVAKAGDVILDRGYGLADRARGIPNTADTIFSIGSVTKQFTAAAVMKLQMQDELRTHDTLGDILDDVPADKADISLHHLLTHTAGLLNYTGEDYTMADRDETVRRILQSDLRFPPGTDFDYSNAGYTLLAAVIEQVTGRPYEEFLREVLFEPARMQHTGYRLPNWSATEVARWYNAGGEFGTPLEKPYPSWNLMGNGDLLSSTGDLHRWHVALSGDDILSEGAKRAMYTPDRREYAYGWRIVDTSLGLCIQHGGSSSHGSSAMFKRWAETDLVLVILCNTDHHGEILARMLESPLEELLASQNVAYPPAIPTGSNLAPGTLDGEYVLPGDGTVLVKSVEGGGVQLTPTSQEGIDWLVMASDTAATARAVEDTQRIMDAAVAGDIEPLVASLSNREARETGVTRTWHGVLADIHPTSATVLGARPSQFVDDAWDVVTRCEGPEDVDYFVCIWRNGENVGVLRSDLPIGSLLVLDARPVGPSSLVGYRLADGGTYEFAIVVADGVPVALRSQSGIEARRSSPAS